MISRSSGFPVASLAPFVLSASLACAQMPSSSSAAAPKGDTATAAHSKTGALMVLNARSVRLAGRTLSLEGVQASAIVFADRPVRRASYMRMPDLVAMWSTGTFAKDPPNATVSAFAADGSKLSDAVVELTSPRLAGDRLTFRRDGAGRQSRRCRRPGLDIHRHGVVRRGWR